MSTELSSAQSVPQIRDEPIPPMPEHLRVWGKWVVYAMLVLGSLVVLPPNVLFYNSLDTPRRLLMLICTGVLVGLILRSWAVRGRCVWRRHPLDLPVLLLFGATVFTGVTGAFPRVSLFGALWCEDSLWLPLIFTVLYFSIKEFLREREEIELLVTLLVGAGALSALWGYLDHYGLLNRILGFWMNVNMSPQRLVGTLGNSMFAGTFYGMLIPLGIGAMLAVRHRLRLAMLSTSVVIMLPALLLTWARAAWVGFGITALLMVLVLICLPIRDPVVSLRRWALVLVVIVGVSLALVWGLNQPHIRARLHSVTNMEDDTIRTRFIYMTGSWNLFKAQPLLGWGLGNIRYVYPQYRPSSVLIEQGTPLNRGYSTAQPHNLILQYAAEMGLIGLIPFFMVMVCFYRAGFRSLRGEGWQIGMGLGFIGLYTANLITNQFAFDDSITMALSWTALGMLATLTAREYARPAWPHGKTLRLVNVASLVVGGWIVLMAVFQIIGSIAMQTGVGHLMTAYNLQPGHRSAAQAASATRGVNWIRAAAVFTPFGEYAVYQALALAYKAVRDVTADEDEARTANQAMVDTANIALRLNPRDPISNRYLVMEYLSAESMSSPAAEENIKKARVILERVREFEPNSAEVRLMCANLALHERNPQQALQQAEAALRLDPTFCDSMLMVAHYQHLNIMQDPVGANDAGVTSESSVAFFRSALANGGRLDPTLRLSYTIELLISDLTRRSTAEKMRKDGKGQAAVAEERKAREYARLAAEQGRILRETPDAFAVLRQWVGQMYSTADGARMLAAMGDNPSLTATLSPDRVFRMPGGAPRGH